MAIPVPTLSTSGWVADLAPKIDTLLAHFISTDYEQSNVYRDSITSLQYIVEQYSGDPLGTGEAIAQAAQRYLGRYYENVVCDARWTLEDEKESQTTVKITLSLNFTEDGKSYTANRLLTYFNGKFKSIVTVNNG